MRKMNIDEISKIENEELRVIAYKLLATEKRVYERKREFKTLKVKTRKIRFLPVYPDTCQIYINGVLAFVIKVNEKNECQVIKSECQIPEEVVEQVEIMP
jgi:hypothetical protein